MTLSRRQLMAAGVAVLVGGCAQQSTTSSQRPGVVWPSHGSAPPRPPVAAPPVQPAVVTPPSPTSVALNAIPRAQWAQAAPLGDRLNAMNGINRITLHHEGHHAVYFSDQATTASRLDLIRRSHLNRLRAGDIGYHYVIDRAGRVWEGRSVQYQGAHAGGANNRHNVGIMLLGNFDEQTPTDVQLAAMTRTVRALQHQYNIPLSEVYTHQELSPTRCPGTHLQPRLVAMRHGRHFG